MTFQRVFQILMCLSLLLLATTAVAVQRMGLIGGSSATIGPHGKGSLSARCVDESESAPSTATRYTQVLNARSPEAVVVEIGGRKVPLPQALREGIVRISGMTEPPPPGMWVYANIDEVRIENLTAKEIRVKVTESVVLGTNEHKATDGPVLELLDKKPTQQELWDKQEELAKRETRAELAKLSTKEMNLFSISASDQGFEVFFGKGSAQVSKQDIDQMQKGTPLDPNHPLTKMLNAEEQGAFVLYTEKSEGTSLKDADRLVFAMQKAYPNKHIYRDPYSAATGDLAAKLNALRVSSPRDFVAVIAGDSFNATDWNILQNILPDLKAKGLEKGIKVQKGQVPVWKGGTGKAVIVITGHIDEQLVAFVHELGKAGYYRDNYIILNSCNEPATRTLASSIVKDYGAVGAFCYDSKIKAASVESFMLDLIETVRKGIDKRFVDLMNSTIRKHNLNGVWTLSRVLTPSEFQTKTYGGIASC